MFKNYDNIFKKSAKRNRSNNEGCFGNALKRWGWEIHHHSEDVYSGVLTDEVKVLKLTVSMFRS